MNFIDAVNKTFTLVDFERNQNFPMHSTFHLQRISEFLDQLSNPHLKIPAIHVAGTKGKGSVCSMISSVLSQSGYKVGLITSPHLHSVTERIRIGYSPIDQNDFIDLVNELWPKVENYNRTSCYGELTWFEFMIAASFYYFEKCDADFQVVETGLGGRLDATNVLLPKVSVITSISLDHTKILGETIEEIAFEKGGIIKSGIPVVLSPQTFYEATEVIKDIANKRNSKLVNVSDLFSVQNVCNFKEFQVFDVKTEHSNFQLELGLLGHHQIENSLTALGAINVLKKSGVEIPQNAIDQGFKNVRWSGRLEYLSTGQSGFELLVDGAHNVYSMECLVREIKNLKYKNLILIFGGFNSHDLEGMLKVLLELDPILIGVNSRHPKSVQASVIDSISENIKFRKRFFYDSVEEGFDYASNISVEGDLILATGSLSVVAEVIESQKEMLPELYQKF
ncbi:MAG: hypothetical protein CL734_06775 [Chloroflexi bacterium]|nr:hypothetical protein [Chloroflexota bacterium]